ncbi:phosphoglycerate kinase [Saccharopolyspora spinosa]|uniref:Phosphoglycerate kinase n=2 Tax=Saccharopolyspora spinosa TaxID=60894 RepID=A0A2N3Y063_SACSN|nr:phosphoglycerate kinase [Saccharopolyspora spinosa]PKW16309.1 phosphoglycerate kinase [Saccharopolyspora spinosa]
MRSEGMRGVRLLSQQEIRCGQRWIYSAGFNVGRALADTGRIDEELPAIERLLDAGARVAVLSHQGNGVDDANELDFVADYIADRLGRTVGYFPGNATPDAVDRAHALRAGEAVVFGNTRKHAGEMTNSAELAGRFAALGDCAAIGGFSKAHRAHASNVGLLGHRPAFAADSLVHETGLLAPWAGSSDELYSVAVLGGVKPEKTAIGLEHLTATYDLVIPGGAVLNNLLRALGHDIGSSTVGSRPEKCLQVSRNVLNRANRAELHIPDEVVIARPTGRDFADARTIPVSRGVPSDYAIVDFVLAPWVCAKLDHLTSHGGRAFIAGTPARYTEGFTRASDALLGALGHDRVNALLLGGDTTADLPWNGTKSTGGGSALHYLAYGTCPVFDALRTNALRWEATL